MQCAGKRFNTWLLSVGCWTFNLSSQSDKGGQNEHQALGVGQFGRFSGV